MRSRATLRRTLLPDRLSRQANSSRERASPRTPTAAARRDGRRAAAEPVRLRRRQGRESASRWSSAACRSPAISRCRSPASAKAASIKAGTADEPQFEFEYSKYSGWPEIKESLMAGRIQAAYMLAPLVMDLADKKIPVKIVSLGHRSGAVIMVRTDSPYQHFTRARGQAHRDPEPLRGRLPVPAQDARAREHDAEGHRDRRDAAARHAGGAVREGGRCLLHRRAVRRRRADAPATRACCA